MRNYRIRLRKHQKNTGIIMVLSWHYPAIPYLDKMELRFDTDGTFRLTEETLISRMAHFGFTKQKTGKENTSYSDFRIWH
ncbi:MAG: hypothetical protein PHT07_16345 [Paludibacter sp.]|nr:hypothetical protein [Paludibacter sp.]